jgi:hypothetical protein
MLRGLAKDFEYGASPIPSNLATKSTHHPGAAHCNKTQESRAFATYSKYSLYTNSFCNFKKYTCNFNDKNISDNMYALKIYIHI